ncbi:MAG: hypothetical protein ABIP29_11235 [Candidatus Eisenbacteria bacterium]
MPARHASVVLLLLFPIANPVAADERDRFHAWFSAGPTFLLSGTPPDIPSPPVLLSAIGRPAAALAFPVGENPKGAIPQFQAGVAFDVTPRVAVSFDLRRLEVELRPARSGIEALRRSVLAWGPGVRRTVGDGATRPFLQANVLMITEAFHGAERDGSGIGVGLGLLAGADLRVTDALSIPIAANVLLGQAINDVSSVGLVAGLAVHPSTGWSADPAIRAIEIAAAQTATANVPNPDREQTRDRLAVSLGYAWYTGGLLQLEGLDDAGQAGVGYRHPLGHRLEMAFDVGLHRTLRSESGTDGWQATPMETIEERSTILFCGPGLRWTVIGRDTRPFVQASVLAARESRQENSPWVEDWSGIGPGWAVMAGFEPRLGKRWSLPIEMILLRAKPVTDVASTGFRLGIAREFGRPSS